MKDALAQQANDLAGDSGAIGGGGNGTLAAELRESQKRCVLLEARLVQLDALAANSHNNSGDNSNTGIINALSEVSAQLALCKAELTEANRTIEVKNQRIAELEAQISQAQSATGGLASDRVIGDAQVSELRRKLASAENDIQRLVKERSQLMELSNQLRADLRKLKDSGGSGGHSPELKGPEFAGKKDYENLVAELSRSLEESRLHNKTLKKELRRMLKHQVIASQDSNYTPPAEDARRRTMSMASSNAATDLTVDGNTTGRRRSSTLSMMKALDSNTSLAPTQSDFNTGPERSAHSDGIRPSVAESVESSGSDFDAELLSLVRNKRPSSGGDDGTGGVGGVPPSPFLERKRSSASSSSRGSLNASVQQIRAAPSASRPKSIPERDNEDEYDEENDSDNGSRRRTSSSSREEKRSSLSVNANGSKSALSSLFQRDRLDSVASNDDTNTTAKVSDARLRLQQDILLILSLSMPLIRVSSVTISYGQCCP